jgi:plastocyanin
MVAGPAAHDIDGAKEGWRRQLTQGLDMRGMRQLLQAIVVTALAAGCGGGSMTTAPTTNPPAGGGTGSGGYGDGGGAGGQGGGTGGMSGGTGGIPISNAVTITVGTDFFRSDRNGSVNAAVDTIPAGGTVTWTWTNTASVPHSIQSVATPSFTSSAIETGSGSTYQQTFTTPGTYRYNCAVHGDLMTGVVVVAAQ